MTMSKKFAFAAFGGMLAMALSACGDKGSSVKSLDEEFAQKFISVCFETPSEAECQKVMDKLQHLPKVRQDSVMQIVMKADKLRLNFAKSKASEVTPFLEAYKNRQEAYFIKTNEFGSWNQIGYKSPGETNNFKYIEQGYGIKAMSKVDLYDCPANSAWIVSITLDGKFDCVVESSAEEACKKLTPRFTAICR